MDQATSLPNIVNRTDPTINSTKPSETLHPYYYTTFQEQCTGSKPDPADSKPSKDRLPIPQKYKEEAQRILEEINSGLIQDLTDVAGWTSVIPTILFEKHDNVPLQRYLIDRGMARTMNDARIINWIPSFKPLYPIRTLGNGNCLIHAVLIAMAGIHDVNLYLRDRLAQFIDENKTLLKIHWRIERLKSDKNYGISSEEPKLDDEWNELCDLVHYENSADGQTATSLQFLEAVHVFSLANMLRRPIIVLSEDIIRNKNGEAISVNDLYGIYLPILSQSNECIKEPIILAYDRSHFCPLQTSNMSTDRTLDNLLPLYLSIEHTYDRRLLPIRFLGDDGSVEHSNDLLGDYLQIKKVKPRLNSTSEPVSILCAELGAKNPEIAKMFFSLYHKYLKNFFEIQKPEAIEEQRKREVQDEVDEYLSRYGSYNANNRSTVRQDTFSSPLSSSRSTNGLASTQLRRQTDRLYEQTYPSTTSAYIPNNAGIQFSNHSSEPHSSRRSPTYTRITRPTLTTDQTRSDLADQYGRDNLISISNMGNHKVTNQVYIDTRDDGSYIYRGGAPTQQTAIPIPVQILSPRSSSSNQNSTPSYRQTVPTNICTLCSRRLPDYSTTNLCSDFKPAVVPDQQTSMCPHTILFTLLRYHQHEKQNFGLSLCVRVIESFISSTNTMKCISCNERNGSVRCEGCSALFCLPCMNKHHDDLAQRFQQLWDVRNEVKHCLNTVKSTPTEEEQIACLTEIDEWEHETVRRIRQIAGQVRTNVNEIISNHMEEILHRFEQLSGSMQQQEKQGDYLENDIERVNKQLDQMKDDIKYVNEMVQIDFTASKNVEWDALIYVGEPKPPRSGTAGSTSTIGVNTKGIPAAVKPNSIPVQVTRSSSFSVNSNRETLRSRTCHLCHRIFQNSTSAHCCLTCTQRFLVTTSSQKDNLQLPTRDRNLVVTAPTASATKSPLLIYCPQCNIGSLLNDRSNNAKYFCAVCRNLMYPA